MCRESSKPHVHPQLFRVIHAMCVRSSQLETCLNNKCNPSVGVHAVFDVKHLALVEEVDK